MQLNITSCRLGRRANTIPPPTSAVQSFPVPCCPHVPTPTCKSLLLPALLPPRPPARPPPFLSTTNLAKSSPSSPLSLCLASALAAPPAPPPPPWVRACQPGGAEPAAARRRGQAAASQKTTLVCTLGACTSQASGQQRATLGAFRTCACAFSGLLLLLLLLLLPLWLLLLGRCRRGTGGRGGCWRRRGGRGSSRTWCCSRRAPTRRCVQELIHDGDTLWVISHEVLQRESTCNVGLQRLPPLLQERNTRAVP